MAMAGGKANDRVVAHKLHRQFGHPRPEKLITLIRNAQATTANLEKQLDLFLILVGLAYDLSGQTQDLLFVFLWQIGSMK